MEIKIGTKIRIKARSDCNYCRWCREKDKEAVIVDIKCATYYCFVYPTPAPPKKINNAYFHLTTCNPDDFEILSTPNVQLTFDWFDNERSCIQK